MMAIIVNHIPGSTLMARITYPYELVGFFFIGGITFGLKESFGKFAVSKLKRLVLPVFAFGLINLALAFFSKGIDIQERLKGIFLQIPGHWDDMWFVACLFVMEMIYYPIARFIKPDIWRGIAVITLATCGLAWSSYTEIPLPWHLVNAFIFIPVLCIGHVFKTRGIISKWCGGIRYNILSVLILAVLYLVAVLAVNNWPIDVHLLQFGNFTVFCISAILGLWLLVSLSMLLEKINGGWILKFTGFVGANTLVYYGFQSKVISVLIAMVSTLPISLQLDTVFIQCIVWMAAILLLVIPTVLVNRYCPFLLGKF